MTPKKKPSSRSSLTKSKSSTPQVESTATSTRGPAKKSIADMTDKEYAQAWADAMVAHLNAPDIE